MFSGFKTHKWTSSLTLNYFLWRDRKGAISNFVSFLAMLVMIQLLLLLAYESLWPDAAFPFYFQRQRMVNDSAVAKLWLDD